MQKQSWTEHDLHLRTRQSGTSNFCNHQQNILDRCLGLTDGLYVPFLAFTLFYAFSPCFSPENFQFQVEIFTAGFAASLSSLLNQLDPVLRKTANLGRWNHHVCLNLIVSVRLSKFSCFGNLLTQLWHAWNSWHVISPVETVGYVEVVDELLAVQNKSYEKPTILVAKSVKGDGAVAVLTPDMPDVLSRVSVRARNSKVLALVLHLLSQL